MPLCRSRGLGMPRGEVYTLIEKRQRCLGYLAVLGEETIRGCLAGCEDIISDVA